jgi:protein-tyrosine phosphatase
MDVVATIATPAGAPLDVGCAGPEDLDALAAMDASATRRLATLGIDPGQPPRPIRAILAERVARGEVYAASRDGVPVAMLTLQWSDPYAWADQPPGVAAYVHGLAARHEAAGQGVGLALLRHVERVVAAAGGTAVRLDCDADNPRLRAYYERAGYVHRGDVALPHRRASRYERRVGGATEPD